MYIGLTDGQSVTIIWGWVLVTFLSLAIAASLAEICAVYPTSGGVYYWSAMLSTKKWAPIMSFINGWLTLVGNWTVTLSINFSGGQMILSAIALWDEDFVPTTWQTVLMFWAVMLVCALINIFGSRYLNLINNVCIYWTSASVIIILVTVLVMADDKRSGEFVFGEFDASRSGWYVRLIQVAWAAANYLPIGQAVGPFSSGFYKLHIPSQVTVWCQPCVRRSKIHTLKFPRRLFSPWRRPE